MDQVDVGAPPGVATPPEEARRFYDAWADGYSASMQEWGYDTHNHAAALLRRHLPTDTKRLTLLDAGAGDGLSGRALRDAGYGSLVSITGVDLSPKLLKIASERGVYNDLRVLDLGQALPFASGSFDAVTCISTLTYLAPSSGVLSELCRVCAHGGFVVFNVRTDHLSSWEAAQSSLVRRGAWRLAERTAPLAYLPLNASYSSRILTTLFCYERT